MRGHYTYYFIYSSIKNHELCYCTSRYPDRDFVWRGTIVSNGSIPQVEMTSCGLNGAPLRARGTYPAAIACNLTRGRMPHAANGLCKKDIPFITERGGETYITAIRSGTKVGYKY